MPGRKTRANNGEGSGAKNGPVSVRRVRPAEPWTEDQARDLIYQGYAAEAIAKKTGFPVAWVKAQPMPRSSLEAKLMGRRTA